MLASSLLDDIQFIQALEWDSFDRSGLKLRDMFFIANKRREIIARSEFRVLQVRQNAPAAMILISILVSIQDWDHDYM